MLRATLEAESRRRLSGQEVAMAGSKKPDGPEDPSPGGADRADGDGRGDLERRSRELGDALAAKRPATAARSEGGDTGGMAGFGQALKLSSEFIAGVAVGAGLGWLLDSVAGTSPWGLIVLLLLGFAAGVLNVRRSAGLVAERKTGISRAGDRPRDDK
jgi:ATP synthase protein I